MVDRRKYIHYGSCRFDKSRFIKIVNREMFVKPGGGLWASPVESKYGWRQWCESERFHTGRLGWSFEFTLSPGAKVLHIFAVEDLDELPKQACEGQLPYVCLDFEKLLADGYDAVELHLSEDRSYGGFMAVLYWALYGWDCDSILVMNPDVIVVEDEDGREEN